jgi:hypothetical protein
VHRIAAEMRAIADSYGARGLGERVLIGEIYLPVDRLMQYYGGERPGVHLPFNFQLIDTPWSARSLAAAITNYEAALPSGAWPNWVLGNHDRPRVATKRGQAQGPCRGDAVADAPRHAHDLLWRRTGPERCRDRSIPKFGTRASCASPVWRWAEIPCARRCRGMRARMRVYHGQSLVAAQFRLANAQRGDG